jgi:hypothetical protein
MAMKVEVTKQNSKQDYEKDPDTNKDWIEHIMWKQPKDDTK